MSAGFSEYSVFVIAVGSIILDTLQNAMVYSFYKTNKRRKRRDFDQHAEANPIDEVWVDLTWATSTSLFPSS